MASQKLPVALFPLSINTLSPPLHLPPSLPIAGTSPSVLKITSMNYYLCFLLNCLSNLLMTSIITSIIPLTTLLINWMNTFIISDYHFDHLYHYIYYYFYYFGSYLWLSIITFIISGYGFNNVYLFLLSFDLVYSTSRDYWYPSRTVPEDIQMLL